LRVEYIRLSFGGFSLMPSENQASVGRPPDGHRSSDLEPSMGSGEIEQESYEMPPREGFTVTSFITVADIDRSADFYEKVFGGRILSRGDSKGASGHIQMANTRPIVNAGGGPTLDEPCNAKRPRRPG
jgi:hypothetical protein